MVSTSPWPFLHSEMAKNISCNRNIFLINLILLIPDGSLEYQSGGKGLEACDIFESHSTHHGPMKYSCSPDRSV